MQTSRQLETPAPAPSPALPKVTANPGYPFVTVSQLSVPVFETEIGAPALDPLEYVGTYRPPDASAHSVRTAIEP